MATIDSRKVTAAQVDNVPAGDIAATDVQAALNELDGEKTSVATLASTATGDGASDVGIEDAGANFAATDVEAALAELAAAGGAVDSVFGRIGVVVAASSDYDAVQVDNVPAGDIAATNVQAALNELDGEKTSVATLASTATGDGASDVGIEDAGANYAATDVEAALAEIGGAAPVDSVHSRTGAVVSATSDYDAVQIDNTPAGDIVATNVQAAIDELDGEKTSAADLASIANTLGASLVGVEDSAGNYASTEVEATLAEIAALITNLGLATANQWRFSTTLTDANPGSGRFRANNATPASITQLFISNVNQKGVDVSVFLLDKNPGDVLYIQETADSVKFLLVQLSADPIDATTYVKFPVTILDSGTLFTNNRDASFITELHVTEAVDVPVDDAGGFFTGTELEAVTQELGQFDTDLGSTANGDGASLVGIEDSAGDYAATDVEAALAEIGGAPPVDSVFTRTGAVVAATSDYDAVQVDNTPAGDIAATNVQAAIDELDGDKTSVADLASTANGDGASLVGIEDVGGNFTSTDVEGALAEIGSGAVMSVFTRTGAVVAETSDYDAVQVDNTPAGDIVATNVQAAIDELDGDKASSADLASTANALGASLVGIEDVAGDYTATDVEAALAEIGGAAPVDSVHGRTGVVVAVAGDYDAAEVTFAPATLGDWDGGSDPGETDDALDQLASRMVDVEGTERFLFFSDQMDTPNNSDWTVNAKAGQLGDTNNAAITVRVFDDTVDEGVGFSLRVPLLATTMNIIYIVRAETTPGGAVVSRWDLYERGFPSGAAPDSWSTAANLTNVSHGVNEFFEEQNDSRTIASWGLTAGRIHQFEFTRNSTDVADTLVGDASLLSIAIEFI